MYIPLGTAFRVHFRVLCIYPKKEMSLGLTKKWRKEWFYLSGSICWVTGRVVTWPITKNGEKQNVVALHCSFPNQFELYSKMLPLWRYEVKHFSQHCIFLVLCVFLHENNIKQHNFNTLRKLGECATTIVSWDIWPKKEGAYPKTDIDTETTED